MDNLALSVTKSITDYLEQNEKRFVTFQSQQEQQAKLLEKYQERIESLESKCEDLTNQNTSLKDELDSIKQRETDTNKELTMAKNDLRKAQEWIDLMAALVAQVEGLNKHRDVLDKKFEDMHKSQNEQIHLIERLQRQVQTTTKAASEALAAASSITKMSNNNHSVLNGTRIPVRSPSTSSFFSSNFNNNHYHHAHTPTPPRYNNNHQSSPSNQYHNHMPRDDYLGPIDPNYELIEISEDAESLIKGVHAINSLQRSFEKSSICSDE